jgi:hypothetical protein
MRVRGSGGLDAFSTRPSGCAMLRAGVGSRPPCPDGRQSAGWSHTAAAGRSWNARSGPSPWRQGIPAATRARGSHSGLRRAGTVSGRAAPVRRTRQAGRTLDHTRSGVSDPGATRQRRDALPTRCKLRPSGPGTPWNDRNHASIRTCRGSSSDPHFALSRRQRGRAAIRMRSRSPSGYRCTNGILLYRERNGWTRITARSRRTYCPHGGAMQDCDPVTPALGGMWRLTAFRSADDLGHLF